MCGGPLPYKPWTHAVSETSLPTRPYAYGIYDRFREWPTVYAVRHLAVLVDRLASRLGRKRVSRVQLDADAQPERACRYIALAGKRTRCTNQAGDGKGEDRAENGK